MAYRSSTEAAGASGGDSFTISVPTGVAANDIVVLVVELDYPSGTITWPSGFTQLAATTTIDGVHAVAWKRLTGADSGTYTITSTVPSGLGYAANALAFSGRHTTNNPAVSTAAVQNTVQSAPVTVTANGVTAVAGDDLIWFASMDADASGQGSVFTPPSGYTERQETGGATDQWCYISTATVDNVSAGATGSVAGTFTSYDARWASYLVRVPEAATASGQPATKRAGGIPWMGAHGAGFASAARRWIARTPRPAFATNLLRRATDGQY